MMERIGIFGGMFDPVHIGHLQPAVEAQEHLHLDKVCMVPCAKPPHRQICYLEFEHRTRLLEAACERFPEFEVDTCEDQRAGPSYTIDTVKEFRNRHPDAILFLLVGSDAFADFATWKDWQDIFEHAHVVVLHRPGFPPMPGGALGDEFHVRKVNVLTDLQLKPAGSIGNLAVTQLEISSTLVRERIRRQLDVAYLVPDSVRKLIIENNWYTNSVES